MNERENALKVMKHEVPEWVPNMIDAIEYVGFWGENEQGVRSLAQGETQANDIFGVPWTMENGAPMGLPNYSAFDDISEWREYVTIPDPDTWDWEYIRDFELANYDGTKLLGWFSEVGPFDRLVAEMGFMNALCALAEDPDSCSEFFEAVTDFKIKIIHLVAKHIKPDIFVYTDDIATSTGLFMHPDVYRAQLKNAHARAIQAIRDEGMIAQFHTCGKADSVVADYHEIGVQIWFPAQPTNDLVGIKEQYGDDMIILGGFDTQGAAGQRTASEEMVRAEARRVIDTYAAGGGFISLVPAPLNAGKKFDDDRDSIIMNWYLDEFRKYGKEFYSNPENRRFDADKARKLQAAAGF